MVRWIVFEDETADALVGKYKRGAAEISEGDVLQKAIQHEQSSILLYPSSSLERVLLVRVTPASVLNEQPDTARPIPPKPTRPNVAVVAALQMQKKSWWRRTA